MAESTTTAPCPGCGEPLTLVPVDGVKGRLRGTCKCNGGKPVLEVWGKDVARKRKRKGRGKDGQADRGKSPTDVLGGGAGEDDTGSGLSFAP